MSFKKKKPSHYETCTPTIPSEIFGLIIADIASEGDTTLKDLQAVSLVCRHFLVLCTPHLFAHLRIKVSSSGIQYIRHLFQLLDANPSLAKHTTKLTVICEARHKLVVDSTSKDSIVISIEPLIKRFLSLPKIDSLSIQGGPLPMMLGEDPWYIMSPPHGSGYPLFLDRYTNTNHITTLSLTGIMEVPYLNVLLIPNLISLELKHCCGELSLAEAPASRELALEIKKGKLVSSIKHFFAENVQITSLIHIARFLPNVETMYLKEIKWDGLAGFWDMDDEWIDLVMLSGPQPLWLTYPNLRKLSSMGAVSLQVVANQRSDIKQLPALKELELQQLKDWDVQCHERIYRHLTCLEVLKIRGTLPKKPYYKNNLSWYALPTVVGQNRRTLKEISIAEHGLRGCSETTIEVLHDALRNIRKDNVLETILLDLSFNLTDMKMLRKPFDQWRRMATLLVGKPENFPCVKKVDILVCLQGSSAVFSGRNKRDLEGFLLEPLWQLLTTTNFSAHCKVSVKEV